MIYFYKLPREISTINKLRTTISKKKEMQENYNLYRVDEFEMKILYIEEGRESKVRVKCGNILKMLFMWICKWE